MTELRYGIHGIINDWMTPSKKDKYIFEVADLVTTFIEEQGYRKQGWISVEDRLPDIFLYEESNPVLVIYGKHMHVANYDYRRNKWDDRGEGFDIKPTHWQPLPEPPKMKG